MIARVASESVVTAPRDATVSAVAQLMRAHRVGCIVIVDGPRPVGILTDRDLALRVVAESRSATTRASEVMTPDPIVAHESIGIETMLSTLRRAGARRLPLVDNQGNLVGIVTHDDLLRLLARELAEIGEGLERSVDASELR